MEFTTINFHFLLHPQQTYVLNLSEIGWEMQSVEWKDIKWNMYNVFNDSRGSTGQDRCYFHTPILGAVVKAAA